MNLLNANPLTLAYNYLLLYMYGTSLDNLHNDFSTSDKVNDQDAAKERFGGFVKDHDTYDFIVVGGGSAGSVVASRLTEENFTVLLLEAGGNPFPLTAVPAMAFPLLKNPNIDWANEIVPQKIGCQAMNNKGPIWNRGKLLGGGSNLNFMVYMRGCPTDFNNWAYLTGDPSWAFENVLPFFKKMEDYHGSFAGDETYHSTGGPLYVSRSPYEPFREEFLKAGEELGYQIKDPNGNQTESFFPLDSTTKDGTRFSTHRGYIFPALSRGNLRVRIYAHATKIQFDGQNRAVGVRYLQNGREHYAAARKEVILSAGTLGSSQLLMLSGIGPAEHLKSHGIPVRVNLPVGQGLQDHQFSYIGPFIADKGTGVRELNYNTLHEYLQSGQGPLSSLGIGGGALIASSISYPSWPDIYFILISMGLSEQSVKDLEQVTGVRTGVLQQYLRSDYGSDAFFIACALALPQSRGEVRLRSTNPLDRVEIDPKYFDVPDDLQVMIEGAKVAVKVGNGTAALREVGAKLTTSLFPGCEQFGDAHSDEYWKCFVTSWTQTMWHHSCTCRMGKGPDDPVAVVDSKLRVIGTKGLRVVDGSIMPQVTNANTNVPIIMIGEKGAHMIKQAWKSE